MRLLKRVSRMPIEVIGVEAYDIGNLSMSFKFIAGVAARFCSRDGICYAPSAAKNGAVERNHLCAL